MRFCLSVHHGSCSQAGVIRLSPSAVHGPLLQLTLLFHGVAYW
jgi:hypothetical protein